LREPHFDTAPGDRYDVTLWNHDPDGSPPKIARWFKLSVADLVDPEEDYGGCSRRVEALAWMIREADGHTSHRQRQEQTFLDTLMGRGTVGWIDDLMVGGNHWRKFLAEFLRWAILAGHPNPATKALRDRLGLSYGTLLTVPGPTIADRHEISRLLEAILPIRGDLAWQLNTCHSGAISIHDIRLRLGKNAYVELEYGYPNDSSSWSRILACQRAGEPLVFALRRAGKRLGHLLDPLAEPPTVDAWASHGGEPAKLAPWVTQEKGLVNAALEIEP
jgi:hypothetical protein